MESLGKKLKNLREEQGWTYDHVSRETNISRQYLEALEREDFSGFPGEPYVLGFLKNYSDFLGIKQEEALSLYRSLRIQEQPVPVEQLLKKPSPLPKIVAVAAVVLVLAGIAAGAAYVIPRFPQSQSPQAPVQEARTAQEHTMNADFLERRLHPGDSVLVSAGSDSYRLTFASLGDAVTINTPRGPVMLDLGQEVTINLSDNNFAELRITAADFVRNDSAPGALLRFEQIAVPQPEAAVEPGLPPEPLPRGQETLTIIPSSPSPFPFTLQAAFQSFCLFRYEVLREAGRQERNERLYQRTEEQSVTAQNGIRLGISNAQAVRLQVAAGGNTIPFEAGGPGEVVAADLRWIRDDDHRFRLVLIRLE